MKLLTSQKVELLRIASSNGLKETDIDLVGEYDSYSKIFYSAKYKPNPQYFLTLYTSAESGLDEYKMTPGETELEEKDSIQRGVRFSYTYLKEYFYDWTRCIKRELHFDDIWDQIQKGKFISPDLPTKEKFTNDEIKLLNENIKQLKIEIGKIPFLLEEQKQFIHHEIEELEKRQGQITKKDFYLLLIGTVVNWATTYGVTPEQSALVWTALKLFFKSQNLIPHIL